MMQDWTAGLPAACLPGVQGPVPARSNDKGPRRAERYALRPLLWRRQRNADLVRPGLPESACAVVACRDDRFPFRVESGAEYYVFVTAQHGERVAPPVPDPCSGVSTR